jgi:hypothetical protein
VNIAAGAGRVTLSWRGVSGAASYVVYRGLSPSSLSLYRSVLTGTQFLDTAVTSGTRYYYAVATVSDDGVQGPLSWIRSALPT